MRYNILLSCCAGPAVEWREWEEEKLSFFIREVVGQTSY